MSQPLPLVPLPSPLAPGEVPPVTPEPTEWIIEPGQPDPVPEDLQLAARAGGPLGAELTANLPAADLFGAPMASLDTEQPYRINPVPTVSIDGVDIASGLGGRPLAGQLLVVDGITVHWGRAELLDQPETGTAALDLFDATNSWAISRQLIGHRVNFRWTATYPNDNSTVTLTYFQGRITDVQVAPRTIQQADGSTVHGSLVSLSCASVVADLANITPTVDWPEETMAARRDRILAACPPGLLDHIQLRDAFLPAHVAPVTVANQQSLLDHVLSLYDSCGADRMVFFPYNSGLEMLVRRDYYSARGMAYLWRETANHPRAGKGAYMRGYVVNPNGGGSGYQVYVDARELEYDPTQGIKRSPSQRISRVSVTNPDAANSYQLRTTTLGVPGVNETTEGIRQATLDSAICWNSYADMSATDLQALVSKEGREWTLDALVYDTRRVGGFSDANNVRFWLQGAEVTSVIAIERSFMSTVYGLRPVYGMMGGTITYEGGGWIVSATMSPISTTLPQHEISWSEIDDGSAANQVEWWDDDNPRGLHESLTYEDCKWVTTGVGVLTAQPTDLGWDFIA